ncbi:MAG: tryptophan synthase subunit beta [Firmicutes bacterium]|nr:tryptophan synthase subunit beta [Bacillota bacterium]
MTDDMVPDEKGYFGSFGGRFVPEILAPALDELTEAYRQAKKDPDFQRELYRLLAEWAGRPTPLYEAVNFAEKLGSKARIFLKREDLLHTGAHKINNVLGQGLLAVKMGKKRIIAETGAGQHGVAVAAVCAMLKMECVIYMGEKDMARQSPNVARMQLLGAEVKPAGGENGTLKEAVNEAFRDWVASVRETHYLLGSVVGPHPFPMMVRDFQSVIGREVKEQLKTRYNRLPDYLIACVGGGSNAMGLFYPFVKEQTVKMVGVEAGGQDPASGRHAATLSMGRPGVFHGARSLLLQDADGNIAEVHSISAGLDYPGVGPEHSYLKESGRADYTAVLDKEALQAVEFLSLTEGIIPALESAHALAYTMKLAPSLKEGQIVVVNLSGRGDKDLEIIREQMEGKR